jgi:hypothetical protein
MARGDVSVIILGSHHGEDISMGLLAKTLRQARVSHEEWLESDWDYLNF